MCVCSFFVVIDHFKQLTVVMGRVGSVDILIHLCGAYTDQVDSSSLGWIAITQRRFVICRRVEIVCEGKLLHGVTVRR